MDEECRYRVCYPSGRTFGQTGVFKITRLDEMLIPTILVGDKGAVALDPRGIVIEESTGKVVYNPRTYLSLFGGISAMIWVFDWLQDNPKWAGGLDA